MSTPYKTSNRFSLVSWKPDYIELAVVAISWVLVTASLYIATFVIGQKPIGGMGYFVMYAVVCAALCGIGLPLYWTVVVRKRALVELGLTSRRWAVSLGVQVVLMVTINLPRLLQFQMPAAANLLPLLTLVLTIGLFEAIFWRGWVQMRLEASFGVIPGILLGSVLYSLYHIGYGMRTDELVFLFFVGMMFAIVFRLTKSILILWPLFQPSGQLITLLLDGLALPPIAALGFIEALALMVVLIWLAFRQARKSTSQSILIAASSTKSV